MDTSLLTRPLLTAEDKQFFEDKGYFVLRGALSPKEVAFYRAKLSELVLTPETHPYYSRLYRADFPAARPPENPNNIWAAFDLPLFDEVWYDFAFHPTIALAIDGLIGPDINLYETSCVAKIPGFPGWYRDWHQDSEYSDPQSDESLVTVITYLDDQDGQSGATWVVPGTHKAGALPHQVPTEEFTSKALEVANKAQYDVTGFAPEFRAGDTMIFRARLVHKSGANNTDRSRLSIAYNFINKATMDLKGEPNRYVGASTPITRNGKVYRPGQSLPTDI